MNSNKLEHPKCCICEETSKRMFLNCPENVCETCNMIFEFKKHRTIMYPEID